MVIRIVVEDELSEAVVKKIIYDNTKISDLNFQTIGKRGRGKIKNRVNEFNNQSEALYFVILIDLNSDPCAPELIREWFKHPIRKNLIFRVAVREVEAWILSDIDAISRYFNMNKDLVYKEVGNPDLLTDPKKKLLSIVNRSKNKSLKKDIVKQQGTILLQGSAYNTILSDFVLYNWESDRARVKSTSLNRAILAIKTLFDKDFQ